MTLDSIKAKVAAVEYIRPELNNIMTIAVVKLQNGFIVLGKSAPASPANFNPELGAKFAYEDAVRQVWQLEGYLLREQLHQQESTT